MTQDEICECIKSSKDKELILISLDENIHHEEKEIIAIGLSREDIIKSDVIDMNEIGKLDHLIDIHYDRISEIKGLISRIEDTMVC